jgi:pimeloyl-ACP methyl ester carboxylesterase
MRAVEVPVFLPGFDDHRRRVTTPAADLSYVEVGNGPPALFLHGVATNAYLWAGVVTELADLRRCIAVDLPLHGRSPARADQEMTIGAFADVVAEMCESLNLGPVDLVANDTGGAVAQLFAARHAESLRTLALTNCDTQDNMPPDVFAPTVELARAGRIAAGATALLGDLEAARSAVFGGAFEDPNVLPAEMVGEFLRPVLGTPQTAEKFQSLLASLEPSVLRSVEMALRHLYVPTLIVWGSADEFFDLKWAYWLRETIPGALDVIELPKAKLLFPYERPIELAAHLRRHWEDHVATT